MNNQKYEIAVRGFYIFLGVIAGMVIEGFINNHIVMKLLEALIK